MKSKMLCGGIYEFTDSANNVRRGTLVATITKPNGTQTGTLHWAGFAPELVEEDSERWGQLKLIGRPASPNVGRPKKKG